MHEPAHLLGGRVAYEKVAATYFPAFDCSIIGAEGLNFSVRDGKRWTPSLKPPSCLDGARDGRKCCAKIEFAFVAQGKYCHELLG
jgi:hypothetical protein